MDAANRACNLHQFVRAVLYTGRNKLRYSVREGVKGMIEQGAWKLTKLWAIGDVVRVCTMVCGGVWFGRQLGLPVFWGKLMPPNPENEGNSFLWKYGRLTCETTRRHTREVSNLNIHRCKNLRSHVILTQKTMMIAVVKHLLISLRKKSKGQVPDAQIIFTLRVFLHF